MLSQHIPFPEYKEPHLFPLAPLSRHCWKKAAVEESNHHSLELLPDHQLTSRYGREVKSLFSMGLGDGEATYPVCACAEASIVGQSQGHPPICTTLKRIRGWAMTISDPWLQSSDFVPAVQGSLINRVKGGGLTSMEELICIQTLVLHDAGTAPFALWSLLCAKK